MAHHHVQWYYIAAPIFLIVLLAGVIVAAKKRSRRLRRQRGHVNSVYILPPPQPSTSAQLHHSSYFKPPQLVYKNQENPGYMVPFSALPPNFDFTQPNIQVRGDFVIMKDLNVLSQHRNYMEGYQTQSPYNPNYY